MESARRLRVVGVGCVVGAVVWIIALLIEYGSGLKLLGPLFFLYQALSFTAFACWVATIIGLMWARAAGDGWFGTLVLGLFAFGWIVLMVSIPIGAIAEYGEILPAIGGLASGVGGLLAGIAIATARRWHGWQRWTVLFYALYYAFGLVLPAVIGGQEPDTIRQIIWALAWVPIGFALISSTGQQAQPAMA